MESGSLKTEGLTIGYDSDLIKDIALTVEPGKIVTLIGPNGSGKSTLLKTVTRQLRAREGVIYLNDKSMDDLSYSDISKQMSMVMTSGITPEYMTCREIIETGRYPYTGILGILGDKDKETVKRAVRMTDTDDICDKQFGSISDGQKQRVMLARAICQEPKVLILDEPTSYLDIRYKLDILTRIKDLAKKENIAVVVSLHELEIAMRISDTVVAVGDGKLRRIGTVREVFEESFIRELYGIEGSDISLLGSTPWFCGEEKQVHKGDTFHQKGKAKVIMLQGTMSNAGKSLLTAGLCRILIQDGYRVAPFKSQNMALNSYVTEDGLEMGRAQVVQAQCCRMKPSVFMNPVLLKPTDDVGSQVIVNGTVVGNMKATEYFEYKKKLIPRIKEAYEKLSKEVDIIVVEGAGSPVELNLKNDDIVNMGLAEMIDAPVLLIGDIDRGGVFAQLIGTLDLLTTEERNRVRGLIVNKFRGDRSLFDSGIKILEEKGKKPVVGVVPYMDVKIDDEDSLSERFYVNQRGDIDIAVIRLPHISNFTDFDVFDQIPEAAVRYVDKADDLCKPDILIIPGSKNTVGDLRWLRSKGFETRIVSLAKQGIIVFGICGGYQMLGRIISDPDNTEGGQTETGLMLLPVDTTMESSKIRTVYDGTIVGSSGDLMNIIGRTVSGYEIHTGRTIPYEDIDEFTDKGTGYCKENIYGTYIHGIFDNKEIFTGLLDAVAQKKGISVDMDHAMDQIEYIEKQYDILADRLRESLDMDMIYKILGLDLLKSGEKE